MKSLFIFMNKLNKWIGLKGQHNFILFVFVYMWWTLIVQLGQKKKKKLCYIITSVLQNYVVPL